MAPSFKSFTLLVLEILLFVSITCYADENCETIPTEIHVTKGNQIFDVNTSCSLQLVYVDTCYCYIVFIYHLFPKKVGGNIQRKFLTF